MSRSLKALILAAGNAATALVGLLIAAALSRQFEKSDYATYRQTLLVFEFAAPLLTLGLPAALFYFLPDAKTRARAILLENLLLLGAMGLAFSVFLALGGNLLVARHFSNPDLEKSLLVFSLYPVLFLPASAASACLVVQNKIKWLTIHTIGTRLGRLVLVLGAVWLWPDRPVVAVGAMAVSGLLVLGSALTLMFRAVPPSGEVKPALPGLRAQLQYAVPLGLATMLETLALGIDKVLVSLLCDREQFAVFVNGSMEIPFIRMITAAGMAVILPEIVSLYKEGRRGEVLDLWTRGARKIAVLLLPIGGLLFALAPEMMVVLYSDGYLDSARPFRIYLLLLPARIIFFGVIFQAAGRPDLILKRAVGTLVLNTIISYPLVKYFGFEGAAWGTVIVFWIYVIPYCVLYCSRLLEVSWLRLLPYRHIGLILLAIVISVLATSLLRAWVAPDALFLMVVMLSACFVAVVGPVLLLFCRSELEQYLHAVLRKVRGSRSDS